MTRRRLAILLLSALAVAAILPMATVFGDNGENGENGESTPTPTPPASSAFTYQGRLTDDGALADGSYDLRFILYNSAAGGSQVGSTVNRNNVSVSDGFFAVTLNFGPAAFDGNPRWLEVAIRPGGSDASYTVLNPRQPITAAPYAIHAHTAGSFSLPAEMEGTVENPDVLWLIEQHGTGIGVQVTRTSEAASPSPAILGINGATGPAVQGSSNADGGFGIYGLATGDDGIGGRFVGDVSVQLEGVLEVGGGEPTAFIHAVTGANLCASDRATVIDAPVANGEPLRMLIVTYRGSGNGLDGPVTAVGVAYDPAGTDCDDGHWVIYALDGGESLEAGQQFNVLVIAQ
jgi:hypothetical protein